MYIYIYVCARMHPSTYTDAMSCSGSPKRLSQAMLVNYW